MAHPLSSKFDSTLRYASGLYGLSAAVLAQIASALADAASGLAAAATAQTTANSATTAAASAQTTATSASSAASTASTAAAAAQTTANSAASSATSAGTAAAAAQTTANSATTAAAAAQTTANTAVTAAATASTAAAAAQTTANAAGAAAANAASDATLALTDLGTLYDDVGPHLGAGGLAHALATGAAHGFMSSTEFSKLATLAAGQAGVAGRLTVDAVIEAPTTFAYASSYAIDPSIKNDFAASGTLTGNITFTFTSMAAGQQGFLAVRQDGTGGRTVTFTAPGGWTIYRDTGTANLQAASAANAVTVYTYAFVAVGGLNMLFIGKLSPVAGS